MEPIRHPIFGSAAPPAEHYQPQQTQYNPGMPPVGPPPSRMAPGAVGSASAGPPMMGGPPSTQRVNPLMPGSGMNQLPPTGPSPMSMGMMGPRSSGMMGPPIPPTSYGMGAGAPPPNSGMMPPPSNAMQSNNTKHYQPPAGGGIMPPPSYSYPPTFKGM